LSYIVSGGVVFTQGIAIEYGFVQTDKNYRQAYHTVYSLHTPLSLSANVTVFTINGNGETTFSDWKGAIQETGGNYGLVSGSYGWSSTYTTIGFGFGPGISMPGKGTLGYMNGTTYLDGSPTHISDAESNNYYNPQFPTSP